MQKYRSSILAACLSVIVPSAVFAQAKAEPPVPVRMVAPDYPQELRREGVAGVVMVSCTIDEKGDVQDVTIEKSSNSTFDRPALAAVKKWKFKPAKLDGAAVAKKVTIPLKFSIDES
jgi:protein TonB